MPKQLLNKNHVVVHTATIDVKVLRIEKKQVTMSVFRQIPEENLFRLDDRGWLLVDGDPWGVVHYVWNDSPRWARKYLVFQRDGKLFRMPLPSSLKYVDDNLLQWVALDLTEKLYELGIDPDGWEIGTADFDIYELLAKFMCLDQLFIAV